MDTIIPGTNLPRIIIIGGGFAGINLVKALKNKPVQVVLFDKNNYQTFQPLLYQVATGGLEPDSIAFPLRKLFAEQENFIFRNTEVLKIDTEKSVVETTIGEVSYDYLVVATGSVTNFFGLDLEGKAMGMKNVPEALDLRSLILQNFERATYELDPHLKSALMKFVIVGGGPTGVETAGALSELKRFVLPNDYPELDMRQMEVHLIEAGSKLLNGMSEKSSADALAALEKMGVHVWLNTIVKNYDGQHLETNKSLDFESATVIWSAGVKGNSVEGLPREMHNRGNRIVVDAFNRVKGLENVFAMGDVAFMTEDKNYPEGHPQVAAVAMQQGTNLGYNLINLTKGAPLRAFEYFDKGSMATVGRNKAVVDFPKPAGFHFKGFIAWLMWMGLHLVYLAGGRNRLVTFSNWVWSYFTYDRGARVIIRAFQRKKGAKQELLETIGSRIN